MGDRRTRSGRNFFHTPQLRQGFPVLNTARTMKRGDRIIWTYVHSVGCGTDTIEAEKHGEFLGYAKHIRSSRCRWMGDQMAYVHLDHNKRYSKVAVKDLRSEK